MKGKYFSIYMKQLLGEITKAYSSPFGPGAFPHQLQSRPVIDMSSNIDTCIRLPSVVLEEDPITRELSDADSLQDLPTTTIEETVRLVSGPQVAILVPHGAMCDAGNVSAHAFSASFKEALKIFPLADKLRYRLSKTNGNTHEPNQEDEVEFYRTALILGTSHQFDAPAAAISRRAWKTPFGFAFTDSEFLDRLEALGTVTVDENAHEEEHSIENQLPFLQHLYPNIKIVPVLIGYGGGQSLESVQRLAADLAHVIMSFPDSERILIIGTTDFTHTGPTYEEKPPPEEPIIEYCRSRDIKALRAMRYGNAAELIDVASWYQISMCGVWSSACLLELTSKLGLTQRKLLKYAVSAEIYEREDVTGFASFLFSPA